MSGIQVVKVMHPETRKQALEVIDCVYKKEKHWIEKPDIEISEDIDRQQKMSWFLAFSGNEPAGVLRLIYDPPLSVPEEYQVTFNPDIDWKTIAMHGRFVDIGRFAVLSSHRRNFRISIRLMKKALEEVVSRGYTHFITDVFEGEMHSPLNFHTRILGFDRIGKHVHGELNCKCTRIILALDILKAYQRLRRRKSALYRFLLEGVAGHLDARLINGTYPVSVQ